MYERKVLEPRLTGSWALDSRAPLEPALLEDVRVCLSARYGVLFDSAGFNLYRDGQDSVAWHGDRIRKEIAEPVVALVSLGQRRKLLLRPKGGGSSRAFLLGQGDLFVTGGKAQRKWEHSDYQYQPRKFSSGYLYRTNQHSSNWQRWDSFTK